MLVSDFANLILKCSSKPSLTVLLESTLRKRKASKTLQCRWHPFFSFLESHFTGYVLQVCDWLSWERVQSKKPSGKNSHQQGHWTRYNSIQKWRSFRKEGKVASQSLLPKPANFGKNSACSELGYCEKIANSSRWKSRFLSWLEWNTKSNVIRTSIS